MNIKIPFTSLALVAFFLWQTASAQTQTFGSLLTASETKRSDVATPAIPPEVPPNGPNALGKGPPEWSGPSFADLEKLRSENAILAEQLKNAELKNKLNAQGVTSGSMNTKGPAFNPDTSNTHVTAGPRVVMIAGAEGNYRANLLLANGQSITASVGTSIPGLGSITSITPNAVHFGVGKAKRSLFIVSSGANADYLMTP